MKLNYFYTTPYGTAIISIKRNEKVPFVYFVARNVAIDFEICNRSDSDIYENVKGTFLEF